MNYRERKIAAMIKGVTLLNSKQVAERLNVHIRTVQRLVKAGEFIVVKVGNSNRFIPADIDAYIVKNAY